MPSVDRAFADSKSRVLDTVDELAFTTGNFAGREVLADGSMNIYWKGDAPVDLRLAFKEASGDLTLRLYDNRKYSRADLLLRTNRLVADLEFSKEVGLVGTSVAPNGRVSILSSLPGLSEEGRSRTISMLDLAESLIDFQFEQKPSVNLGSRQVDTSPWSGGSRAAIYKGSSRGWGGCTTGFSMASSNGTGYLVSAYHCLDNTPSQSYWGVYVGDHTKLIAPASNVVAYPSIDIIRLDPEASPATRPEIYWGSWGGSAWKSTIRSWGSNGRGDDVYLSGATSGVRGGKVSEDSYQIPGLPNTYFIRARTAPNPEGPSWMGAEGDSGGPVVSGVSGGSQARGIALRGEVTTTCGSKNSDASSAWCHEYMIYVPISVVQNTLGLVVETA